MFLHAVAAGSAPSPERVFPGSLSALTLLLLRELPEAVPFILQCCSASLAMSEMNFCAASEIRRILRDRGCVGEATGIHGPLCRTPTGFLRLPPPCGHSHAWVRSLKPCPVQVIPCDGVRDLGREELEQLHGPVGAFPYPVSRRTAAAPYPSTVGPAPCPVPSRPTGAALCVGTVGV